MVDLVALEERFRHETRTILLDATYAVVPATAHPLGLGQWLRTLAHHTTESRPLTVSMTARFAFSARLNTSTLDKRWARVRLHGPHRYVMAYRAAALGVLRSLGATLTTATAVLQLSTPGNLYAFVARLDDRLSAADILARMPRNEPEWAFRRYVRPLLPGPGDRRWQVSIGHAIPLHHRRR